MIPPQLPLPDVLKGVDDLIRTDLTNLRNSWFTWLLFAAAVVVLGVIQEGPEVTHESQSVFKKTPSHEQERPSWITFLALLGWMLVALGVAGEFVADAFVWKADGILQEFNDILLADAQKKTGVAGERAARAFERAAQTEREASQENARAAQALHAAELARKEAEGFQLQIAQANERAAKAEKQAAESNRRATEEELSLLQLKAKLADRLLTPQQQQTIAARLKKYAPSRIDILLFGNTPESSRIATAIVVSLQQAGWTVGNVGSAMTGSASGVLVGTHVGSSQDVNAAADSLIAALTEAGIASEKLPQYGDALPAAMTGRWDMKNIAPIRMIVGSKP